MALADERRKTLSARLDNTRFRVELEATKHERTAGTEVATMEPRLIESHSHCSVLGWRIVTYAARLGMCLRRRACAFNQPGGSEGVEERVGGGRDGVCREGD